MLNHNLGKHSVMLSLYINLQLHHQCWEINLLGLPLKDYKELADNSHIRT